jgi:hypothetical protein
MAQRAKAVASGQDMGPPSTFTKEQMKDLMKYKFVPVVYDTIGKTEVPRHRSLNELTVEEMSNLMQETEVWAAEHGVQLPQPGVSYAAR